MNDFKKEYLEIKPGLDKAIKKTLESGFYILGNEVEQFEKEFARYIGTKYAIGVANGMEALQISLMALGVGKGDEVITVSNSAVATALAISNVGAKPVFVDVDEYHHLAVNQIEQKITSKTKAIIPVHLFGQIVDIKSIQKICKKYKLYLIEDACQAHGATLGPKKAGSFGEFGCFSFYPTKNLGAIGDGGAITTNSKTLYEKCRMFRNYGQLNRYEHKIQGLNSRLDELQAAILRLKLTNLDKLVKKRAEIAKLYLAGLKNIGQIRLPKLRQKSFHSFHLFVIETKERGRLQNYLKEKGIQTLIHYPIPIHRQLCYKNYNKINLPKTEELSGSILSLPINPFIEKSEVLEVIKQIKLFYRYEK